MAILSAEGGDVLKARNESKTAELCPTSESKL